MKASTGKRRKYPKDWPKKSGEAWAENRVKASLADLNTLKIHDSYSREGANNWWDEAITPTRLGDPTTTVYLASRDYGEPKPWRNDGPFSLQQSSLLLRTSLISETGSYDGIPEELIDPCREGLP